MRKTNYNDIGDRNARAAFTFSGALTADPQRRNTTGVSVADLLLGLPLNAQGSPTPLAGNYNAFQYYFFAQDDWKVSSWLTLNLGLRHELNTRFIEVQNRISYLDRSFPGGRLLLAGRARPSSRPTPSLMVRQHAVGFSGRHEQLGSARRAGVAAVRQQPHRHPDGVWYLLYHDGRPGHTATRAESTGRLRRQRFGQPGRELRGPGRASGSGTVSGQGRPGLAAPGLERHRLPPPSRTCSSGTSAFSKRWPATPSSN